MSTNNHLDNDTNNKPDNVGGNVNVNNVVCNSNIDVCKILVVSLFLTNDNYQQQQLMIYIFNQIVVDKKCVHFCVISIQL